MGEDLIFGMYVCDSEYVSSICNDEIVSDYKNIDNHYFIKSISEEQAFSTEYGYTKKNIGNISYNHYEKITVPQEVFEGEEGMFVIKIIGFQELLNENDGYYVNQIGYLDLKYQVMDKDTVKIIFSPYRHIYV